MRSVPKKRNPKERGTLTPLTLSETEQKRKKKCNIEKERAEKLTGPRWLAGCISWPLAMTEEFLKLQIVTQSI